MQRKNLIALLLFVCSGSVYAQSDLSPADLKKMQSRVYKLDSAKAIKLIGDDCKDSGGKGSTIPLDSSRPGASSAEVVCYSPTKTMQSGQPANNSVSTGDIASAVGDAITSNASSLSSSAASSLPLIGGLFSLVGAASSISQSNEMVEQSQKQMADMMSSINQVKYEISPSGKSGISLMRIRMYRANQEQVTDSAEYQKRFDLVSTLFDLEPIASK